jgi:hypothetical protein
MFHLKKIEAYIKAFLAYFPINSLDVNFLAEIFHFSSKVL